MVSTRKSNRADEISGEVLERLSFDFRKKRVSAPDGKVDTPLAKEKETE